MKKMIDRCLGEIRDTVQFGELTTVVRTLWACRMAMTAQVVSALAGYGPDHQRDPNFHRHLSELMAEDYQANRPLTSSLVVNKLRRMPGDGYFKTARELGIRIGQEEESEFWQAQLKRLGVVDVATLTIVGGLESRDPGALT
jgi:hypothetical protein